MKVLVSGLGGHMGGEVAALINEGNFSAQLLCGVSKTGVTDGYACGVPCADDFSGANPEADVIIDFSHHAATVEMLDFALANRIPAVIATTGQTAEEKEAIKKASKNLPIFFSSNYSLGIAVLIRMAKTVAAAMPNAEIEIVEKHHDRKLDAPSGTALSIAEALKEVRPNANLVCGRSGQGKRRPEDIGIHAIRMGNIVGEHEVIVGTQSQTITLKHEAHSRAIFAEGALAAAAWLLEKNTPGLYGMEDLLGNM